MAEKPLGNSVLTGIDSVAQPLSAGSQIGGAAPPPARFTHCVIAPEGGAIRWRDDGIAPTVTTGMLLGAGNYMTVFAAAANRIRIIGVSPGVKVNVDYFRS